MNITIETIEYAISELRSKMLKCNDAIDTRKLAEEINFWKSELEKKMQNK